MELQELEVHVNDLSRRIQVAKDNPCHNPGGSSAGGQFCETKGGGSGGGGAGASSVDEKGRVRGAGGFEPGPQRSDAQWKKQEERKYGTPLPLERNAGGNLADMTVTDRKSFLSQATFADITGKKPSVTGEGFNSSPSLNMNASFQNRLSGGMQGGVKSPVVSREVLKPEYKQALSSATASHPMRVAFDGAKSQGWDLDPKGMKRATLKLKNGIPISRGGETAAIHVDGSMRKIT